MAGKSPGRSCCAADAGVNTTHNVTRRGFLAVAATSSAVVVGACGRVDRADESTHGLHGITEDTANLSPDEALARLKDGNARFVAMTEVEPN